MKKWISNSITFHFLPILIGVVLTITCLFFFDKILEMKKGETELISGKQKMLRGTNANCVEGNQAELELAGSLKNPESITIFGSSELGVFPYSPYFFLPDSLHMPTVAFGHAHHQSFAMFCELLAMQKQLKNTKICILISPGWFDTEGTNIEAFLEFVRPNFLKSIIHNREISIESKLEIGKYISENISLIKAPSSSILYFENLYKKKSFSLLNEIIKKLNGGKEVIYTVSTAKNTLPRAIDVDWKKSRSRIQREFIASVKTNKFYISDEYYTQFLLDKDKQYKSGTTNKFNVSTNRELADLKLLVELLKKQECDASFVIQPLNVYHFEGLENYNEIIKSIEKLISDYDYPCLNMFVTKKQDYEPGTLTDVMHLGDYGWMKINEFLVNTYKK